MKINFLIPARGGSKRIPNKNIRGLDGSPLISYIIRAAIKTKLGDVWVSTDNYEIAQISSSYGAQIVKRPDEISGDFSSLEETIAHFIDEIPSDILIICEPTNPLTRVDDLIGAFNKFREKNCDSLVCLQKGKVYIWETFPNGLAQPLSYDYTNRERVQDFDFSKYQYEEGGIYITTTKAFQKSGVRLSGKIGYYSIPHTSINIDDILDFKITELIQKQEDC